MVLYLQRGLSVKMKSRHSMRSLFLYRVYTVETLYKNSEPRQNGVAAVLGVY